MVKKMNFKIRMNNLKNNLKNMPTEDFKALIDIKEVLLFYKNNEKFISYEYNDNKDKALIIFNLTKNEVAISYKYNLEDYIIKGNFSKELNIFFNEKINIATGYFWLNVFKIKDNFIKSHFNNKYKNLIEKFEINEVIEDILISDPNFETYINHFLSFNSIEEYLLFKIELLVLNNVNYIKKFK